MKKLLISLVILLMATAGQSQTVKFDGNGYTLVSKNKDTISRNTGYNLTIKGNAYPVFKSVNGKLYIVRTSKAGNIYKQYLKEEQ